MSKILTCPNCWRKFFAFLDQENALNYEKHKAFCDQEKKAMTISKTKKEVKRNGNNLPG
jgi:hypothetical protein